MDPEQLTGELPENRFFGLIVENAPACIALLRGSDFVFEVVNPAFRAIAPGVPMLGRTVVEVFPDAAPLVVPKLQHVLQSGEPFGVEDQPLSISRYPDSPPDTGYFSFTYTRIADGMSEETHSILVLALETTARKNAEEAKHVAAAELERQWRIFDSVLSNTPDFTYIFDLEGRFTYINRALLALWRKPFEEAVGKDFFDLDYPPELAATLQRQIQEVIQTRAPLRAETPFTDPSGATGHYEYIFVPIFGTSGEVEAVAGSTRDVTERKKTEERHRETAKLESIGVLAGGVAHDFNNLLTGVLANASLAADLLAPSHPVQGLLAEVVGAAELAAVLTRQMLAYSGRGKFIISEINLSSTINEISTLIMSSIPRSVRLRMDFASDTPTVEGDGAQIQQLMMNLIINGAEAVGEREGHVLVRVRKCDLDQNFIRQLNPSFDISPGTYVCIEVNDNGCGMNESTLQRIFDPFFTTKFTGRGLGLSAALGIIRGHNGALKVESRPGRGSKFSIFLPATAAKTEQLPHFTISEAQA